MLITRLLSGRSKPILIPLLDHTRGATLKMPSQQVLSEHARVTSLNLPKLAHVTSLLPLTPPPHSSSLLLTPPHSSSLFLTPPHSSSLLLTPPHSSSLLLTPPHSSSLLLTPPHSSLLLTSPPHSSSSLLLLLTPPPPHSSSSSLLLTPHSTTLHHTPPHSTTLHHTPPHSTTLHHTPPNSTTKIMPDRYLYWASNGLFGSNSSKRTKFGPDVVHTILFRFLMGAGQGRHPRDSVIGEIQYGRH